MTCLVYNIKNSTRAGVFCSFGYLNMGRKKPAKSLKQQAKERLDAKLAIGKSEYLAKLLGTHTNYIFSWDTYRSYLKHCCYFVKWAKQQPIDPILKHKPRTLDECRMCAQLSVCFVRWCEKTREKKSIRSFY